MSFKGLLRSAAMSDGLSVVARSVTALLVMALLATVGCGDDGAGDATAANNEANNEVNNANNEVNNANNEVNNADTLIVTACEEAASSGTMACVASVNAAWAACYGDNGAPCADDDPAILSALEKLGEDVGGACSDQTFGSLEADAAIGRLQNACRAHAAALSWRTFGGPQAAVWEGADDATRSCLLGAHGAGAQLMADNMETLARCLTREGCDAGEVADARQGAVEAAVASIEGACAEPLETLVAVSAETFAERAEHHIDCLAATAHTSAGPLTLSCGPSNIEPGTDWPRGEYVQVVVDGDKWGTLCGDGSPYAFQVRLAPQGARLDRLIVGLQGGGVCVFGEDCSFKAEANPGLFNALDDVPLPVGIASNDPDESAFADWTKVYLPYCNQDVFTGGGVDEDLGSITVPRYGAVNMRAAVQMVRDVIWALMDAEGGAGFRPDEVVTLFGGWSAGGYGTLYNYHWFLDDLLWPRTAAFPDAGLALDNGEALSVRSLGLVKIPAWGALENLPPYCFQGECAVGPIIYNALSPRLKQVPEQQMLIVTNPRDRTQQGDAYFGGEDEEGEWINAVRQSYCETRDLPGIQYYLTNVSDESVHVVSLRPELWNAEVDGERMRDWFERAITDPDTVEDRAEEANFIEDVPGVEPFPCDP